MPIKFLTAKQEKFAQGMAKGLTQYDAYTAAYDCGKMARATIDTHACVAMNHEEIVNRLAEIRHPAEQRFQRFREAWLFELMASAFVDPADFFDREGNPVDIPDLPPACRKMLSGYEIAEEFTGKGENRQSVGYMRKFKMLSKLDALKMFGEALGWFPGQGDKVKGFKAEIKDKDRSIRVEYISAQQGP